MDIDHIVEQLDCLLVDSNIIGSSEWYKNDFYDAQCYAQFDNPFVHHESDLFDHFAATVAFHPQVTTAEPVIHEIDHLFQGLISSRQGLEFRVKCRDYPCFRKQSKTHRTKEITGKEYFDKVFNAYATIRHLLEKRMIAPTDEYLEVEQYVHHIGHELLETRRWRKEANGERTSHAKKQFITGDEGLIAAALLAIRKNNRVGIVTTDYDIVRLMNEVASEGKYLHGFLKNQRIAVHYLGESAATLHVSMEGTRIKEIRERFDGACETRYSLCKQA